MWAESQLIETDALISVDFVFVVMSVSLSFPYNAKYLLQSEHDLDISKHSILTSSMLTCLKVAVIKVRQFFISFTVASLI